LATSGVGNRAVTDSCGVRIAPGFLRTCSCLRTFGGFDCTDECVSHAAGYLWAEEHEIENIERCPENRSAASYEGCLTYVDDPERGAEFDDDGRAIVVPRRSSY
jgi:hypothetical protein